MGGAMNVANRMRVSTSAGAGLFNFLQGIRQSSDINVRDWVNQLTANNLSAYEIADRIIDQVISSGGSLEEESCKDSMAQAMSELLTINPDVDLMNMDNDCIWTVIELFMANEAFNRLDLDIGQLFESAKYSPYEAVSRMNDMREYLKSEISAQIQAMRINTSNPSKEEMNNLLQSALRLTFEIFEEEI
jgi:deoxyhypusine synthase